MLCKNVEKEINCKICECFCFVLYSESDVKDGRDRGKEYRHHLLKPFYISLFLHILNHSSLISHKWDWSTAILEFISFIK